MAIMHNPLGNPTVYPASYDASLLFPIARSDNRIRLGIPDGPLPFRGYDAWRAYEVSWLDPGGKPVVAIGEFLVPASSPQMVESKSFKLYLNSLNQERFAELAQVQALMVRDVSQAAGAAVLVQLYSLNAFADLQCTEPEGLCLDHLDLGVTVYQPDASLLKSSLQDRVEESLYSNLFRSNCPVTAQPDWGTVSIKYSGPAIDHHALLRYLISYRHHNGFHEDCVEQIYTDLQQRCAPEQLSVAINFLRRGGLEINPVRTSAPASVDFPASRLLRQ